MVVGIGLLVAFVRLLPWMLAPAVPLAAAQPLLLAAMAAAIETAFVLGVPLGFALGTSHFIRSGEARALLSLGASPLTLLRSTLALACLWAVVGFGLGAVLNLKLAAPGRLAGSLVGAARSACLAESRGGSATVPVLGASWLCFQNAPPRLAGPLPGSRKALWFSALGVDVSDDMARVSLADLRVTSRPAKSSASLRLRVERADLHGLWTWARPAKLGPAGRAALSAGTGALLGWAGATLVMLLGLSRRRDVWLAVGLSSLGAWLTLTGLDGSRRYSAAAYYWVPLVGVATCALFGLLLGARARLFPGLSARSS